MILFWLLKLFPCSNLFLFKKSYLIIQIFDTYIVIILTLPTLRHIYYKNSIFELNRCSILQIVTQIILPLYLSFTKILFYKEGLMGNPPNRHPYSLYL